MNLGIEGKRAAVAAASTGLGWASAKALHGEGVKVAICGRDQERTEAAAHRIGPGVIAIAADVSTEDGARGFVDQAAESLGGLDILIPNAGGPPPGPPSSTPLDSYRAAIDLNLLSTVVMCQSAVPLMRSGGWGRIVAITSAGARSPIGFLAASSVARAGVTSFLKTLATEVAQDGITVNSIQPGLHATDRVKQLHNAGDLTKGIPMGRIGSPDDFGRLAAFLCSDAANFVTGTGLLVDGGQFSGLV